MILLIEKVNEVKETDCVLVYMRNLGNGKTANYGLRYGQNIKPAGEYMTFDKDNEMNSVKPQFGRV